MQRPGWEAKTREVNPAEDEVRRINKKQVLRGREEALFMIQTEVKPA